jgi:hypothetical protein
VVHPPLPALVVVKDLVVVHSSDAAVMEVPRSRAQDVHATS